MYLLEELPEVCPALMVYPGTGEQPACISSLEDSDAEVDVLPEAHPRESAQGLVHFPPHTHVEAARIELVHLLFTTANTPGRKK